MEKILKGNYNVKKPIIDEKKNESKKDQYRKKALNSISGSMVFVERNELFWDGSEEKK